MSYTEQSAIDEISRRFKEPGTIGLINTDFDGCWGLQVSAALAHVTDTGREVFAQLRQASGKGLFVNTGRPPESLLHSLNRGVLHRISQQPELIHDLGPNIVTPRAVCEMGTVFVSRSRIRLASGNTKNASSPLERVGYEFVPCEIPAPLSQLVVEGAPAYDTEEHKGAVDLLRVVRERSLNLNDQNFEFEPKRFTVTLHSKNGLKSADAQSKLAQVIRDVIGYDPETQRDGSILVLQVPSYQAPDSSVVYKDIKIKITQGHNVADAVPFGVDKESATHAIMGSMAKLNPGKSIFSVTVGDSPIDALITRGAMASKYSAGKFCIRVGNVPFDAHDEANVDLVLPGEKPEAVAKLVDFMQRVTRGLDGLPLRPKTYSLPDSLPEFLKLKNDAFANAK